MIEVNHNTTTEVLFELEIEGLATLANLECRFCIMSEFPMFFICESKGNKQYVAKLPILSSLSLNKSYPFVIEVIADGYFFKALSDTLTVKETIKEIKATIVEPPKQEQPKLPSIDIEKMLGNAVDKVIDKEQKQPKEPVVTKSSPKETQQSTPPMVFKPSKDTSVKFEPVKPPVNKSMEQEEQVVDKKQTSKPAEPPKQKKELTEADKKVLEILAESQKEQHEKLSQEISHELAEVLAKREKSKTVQKILDEHKGT